MSFEGKKSEDDGGKDWFLCVEGFEESWFLIENVSCIEILIVYGSLIEMNINFFS